MKLVLIYITRIVNWLDIRRAEYFDLGHGYEIPSAVAKKCQLDN